MDSDLIIIIVCLIFSALFSGVEIAFLSSNRLKVELDKNKGTISGRILGHFYKKEQNFIGTMLLGNNIALVVFGISFANLVVEVDHTGAKSLWGIEDDALILLIQTLLSTLLVLIVAEFLPKVIFQLNPNRLLKALSVPIYLIYLVLFIPTQFIMIISVFVLKLFKVEITNSEKVFSKIDLEHYVQDINNRIKDEAELGNEMQILQNALDFSKIKARDCMVPRLEIISMEVDESIEDLNRLFIQTGISKILIYRDTIDNVIGYVHSFELFKKPTAIKQVMRPISFVPEAIPGKELLEIFTKQSSSIAVVVDEYGGTAGVITIEDVIEEIFGDIEDEHDSEDWLEEKIDDYNYRFSGRVDIDYLNETHKFSLPESDQYETLGGLIINELESIPESGTIIQIGNYKLIIEEVSDRRIEIVSIEIDN
jgi:CBS domain containing-hemolysin-like protein